jgi:hypothetical protein
MSIGPEPDKRNFLSFAGLQRQLHQGAKDPFDGTIDRPSGKRALASGAGNPLL